MPLSQVLTVEDAIHRISRRVPEMRVMDSLICRVITILGRDITARLDQALRPAGLAELEFRTLLTIFSLEGAATPGDLSASLAQSPANLTRITDVLVARGFITRAVSDQDRRRTLLNITPEGEKLLRELLPEMASYTTALFQGFSAEDKSRLLSDLKRVLGALDALQVRPRATGT
jgi:MarR family transcriptional regulator, negative regulator of the multidrug operon emrRAB